ncbi:hypothetical protein FA10DRAFT_301045 [Acaromyces ingoldii]|uniref:Heme haloperoxidase family profile domain-containing protein n=1 Tax=Acaromyces ingoldii TaxID=215250 RepID=A0A316YUX1_9BASI|nr:hypothetical protein FA10DRAFT_301045 [Acaromyces ingoldii]PWN92584.1 hypothetical protein FA10DRAFT_301045 [Acaromyces ingoldii]
MKLFVNQVFTGLLVTLTATSYAFPAMGWEKLHEFEARAKAAGLGPLESRAATSKNGAEPITDACPFAGAKSALVPGPNKGPYPVPDPKCPNIHQFQAPKPGDERGPCPGTNMMANYGFISRDGLTNYEELVNAQQNMLQIGWDLAVFLAALEVSLSGNPLNDGRISIGGARPDWTNTGLLDPLLGVPGGYDKHNGFESDTSFLRKDQDVARETDGNYGFDQATWKRLIEVCESGKYPKGKEYNFDCAVEARKAQYDYSLATNDRFFFGPYQLILYGTPQFLYKTWATGDLQPNRSLAMTVYGIEEDGKGGYREAPSKLPDNWYTAPEPFTFSSGTTDIIRMYAFNPVSFGGKVDNGTFVPIDSRSLKITNGKLDDPSSNGITCLMQQLLLQESPDIVTNSPLLRVPLSSLNWAKQKTQGMFSGLGCPELTPRGLFPDDHPLVRREQSIASK